MPVQSTELSLETRFLAYPTSAVSDAMDELGIQGVLDGVMAQRAGQGRISGRAMTARFDRKDQDPDAWRFGGGVGKPLEAVLKRMRSGNVVVIDLGGAADAAAWGGLASRLAQLRGVRGTIMWGACRDLEEIRQIGYPVWAVGTCPRRSRGMFSFGAIEEPITVGRATIAPGDIVLADETGVVAIPAGRALEVLELVEKVAAQEASLEEQVRENAVKSWDDI